MQLIRYVSITLAIEHVVFSIVEERGLGPGMVMDFAVQDLKRSRVRHDNLCGRGVVCRQE